MVKPLRSAAPGSDAGLIDSDTGLIDSDWLGHGPSESHTAGEHIAPPAGDGMTRTDVRVIIGSGSRGPGGPRMIHDPG
jgi:hypothetical protein